MPRKALVSKEDAVRTIEKFIEHFRTDELPKFTSQVWVDMSKDLNDKWSSHGVYIAVRENRRGILSEARKNQGIVMPEEREDDEEDEDNENENENARPSSTSGPSVPRWRKKPDIETRVKAHLKSLKSWLYLTLDGDAWNRVKPRMRYKYGERQDTYVTATPTNWTEAIFNAFEREFRFPCAYILKRAKIHDSRDSLHYMEIYAECKSRKCSNRFLGFVDKEPWYGEPLDVKIKTWDTSVDEHEAVHRPIQAAAVKRPVADEDDDRDDRDDDRDDDDDDDGDEKMGKIKRAKNNRTKRAAKKMWSKRATKTEEEEEEEQQQQQQQQREPEAGQFGTDDDPDVGDLVGSIQRLATMPEYLQSVRQIGLLPFSVMYGTAGQIRVYNEYCANGEESSSIKIEMRRDVVKKIRGRNASDTKDVYLLSMIFKSDAVVGDYFMAYQMISEKIDYSSMMYWLGSWLENGARKPAVAISNYCRVFLSAMCLAFNGFSLESYVRRGFAAVSGLESTDYQWQKSSSPAITSVRIDLANLRSIVRHWRCFEKVNHSCIREFYIRCVDLMIEAESFDEFTEMLSLTVVVASSAREDALLLESTKLSPRTCRKKLEAIIAKKPRGVDVDVAGVGESHPPPTNDEPVLEDVFVDTEQLGPVTKWLEALVQRAKSLKTEGTELNAFYLPEFADNLVSIALDFPLWTKFADASVRDNAPSTRVEQYFQHWQPRMLAAAAATAAVSPHQQFPIRADNFVKAHLDEINEAASATLRRSILTDSTVRLGTHRPKDSATSEYHIFDIIKSNASDNDTVVEDEPLESKPSQIELNQQCGQKKAATANRDNILSACILETDELGVCHRRNISLDFSEL